MPPSTLGHPAGPGATVSCAVWGFGAAGGLAATCATGFGLGRGRAAGLGRATVVVVGLVVDVVDVVVVGRIARVVVLKTAPAGCAPLRNSKEAPALVATATSAIITHARTTIATPRCQPQNRIEWLSGPHSGS